MSLITCKNCTAEFSSPSSAAVFCSRKCYGAWKSKQPSTVRIRQCSWCKKNLSRIQCETTAQEHCSRKCSAASRAKKVYDSWVAGDISANRANGIVKNQIRKVLIAVHGDKCSLCGWCEKHPSTGKVPIQIDHIDGNSDNGFFGNLRLLCPNCHSLTPSWGGHNRGKGRKSRGVTKT
jgi:hypothetical protein